MSSIGHNDRIEGMKSLKSWKSWIYIALCLAINFLGKQVAEKLMLPIWFDTVGTMIIAIEMGPVAAAICGALFNMVATVRDAVTLPYMLVSAGIGAFIGVFYPRKKVDSFRLVSAGVASGVIAAMISTPINLYTYNGLTGNIYGDALMDMISRDVQVPVVTTFLGQLFVDLPDKVVSILAAFFLIKLFRVIKRLISKKPNYNKSTGRTLLFLLATATTAGLIFAPVSVKAVDFGAEYAGSLYDIDKGLEAVEINAIAQSDDGFIWIGSYSGLYVFDGYKFKPANLDNRIKNVMVLFKDSKGRMWIGTNDSGVACYNPEDGEIVFYNAMKGLSSDAVRDITEDDHGHIYVATIAELCRIDEDGRITKYDQKSFYGLTKLCASGSSIAGIRSDGYLIIFNDTEINYVLAGNYTEVAVEEEGNYIVGTGTNITGRIYIKDGATDLMSKTYTKELSYFNDILYSKTFGGYFVACENGLGFVSDKGTVTNLSTDDFDSSVDDIFIDYQGNVWFASSKQGIKKFSWNPFEDLFSRANLSADVVNSVIVKNNLLYAGTNNGLVTIDLKTYYSVPIPYPAILKDVRIRNIMCDSKENVWICTYGANGLVKLRADGSIACFNSLNNGMEGDRFRMAMELRDGRIVAASNMGLSYIKGEKVEATLGENDGITAQILSMIETDDGSILAGSDGGGIFVIKDDKVIKTIGPKEGLKTLVVMKIVPCTGGYLYVTSNAIYYDNGTEIKRLENFPYSNNYDVFISEDGKAWVMSSGGIFVLDEKELLADGEYSYMLLNRSRGLNTAITANSNFVKSGEKLYISCTDGVRRVSTNNYDSFNNQFEIALSELTVGDEVIKPTDGVYVIPAKLGRIQFDVAVLNYSLSNPLIHMFLEGAVDEGVTCYQRNMQMLSFTYLPYGDYKLHVQVLDTAGLKVVREEVFEVTKESLLFERPYFKGYLAFVIIMVVMYIGWAVGDFLRNMNNVQRLETEALRDHLTGLLNKRGAEGAMNKVLRRSSGILAVLDLDSFKPVNDLFGHDMGDKILTDFSGLLQKTAGSDDVLCRIGGDEFVAFYIDATENDIKEKTALLNNEILRAARQDLGHDMTVPLGISVGAVRVNAGTGETYDELFKKADKALYIVKNSGKHDYVIYDEALFTSEDSGGGVSTSGIAEVRTILGERNKTNKPYRVENDRLKDIYRLLVRLGDSSVMNSVMIHFTLRGVEEQKVTSEVLESLLEVLKESLRSTDVYGRENKSALVIITGVAPEDADLIIERITEKWKHSSKGSDYKLTYEKEML